MGKSVKLGRGWKAAEGKSWVGTVKLSRAEVISALEQTDDNEDISLMIFTNDFKKNDKSPDFYLNFSPRDEKKSVSKQIVDSTNRKSIF